LSTPGNITDRLTSCHKNYTSGGAYNLINPLRKDTVCVPRRGYVVLKFHADNEGLWMFHCHILWHQASGMSMGFQVLGDAEGIFRDGDGRIRKQARGLCSNSMK
jgi:hypothetical protein